MQLDLKHFKLVQVLTLDFTRNRVGDSNNNRKSKSNKFGAEMHKCYCMAKVSVMGDKMISVWDAWQMLNYLLPAWKKNVKATVHLP